MESIDVYLLPDLVAPQQLAGRHVVVIDVLRATTTIAAALHQGAEGVIPCREVDDARRLVAGQHDLLTGGERGGIKIEGFDLGNSPSEYTRRRVAGRWIAFTTTNGTRAMDRARLARRILLAAFVNWSATWQEIEDWPQADIICAGTDGSVTREDVLLAGALVEDARRRSAGVVRSNDGGQLAWDAWRSAQDQLGGGPLAAILRQSGGGRNLIELGSERDVELAAEIDRYPVVAELEVDRWQIVRR